MANMDDLIEDSESGDRYIELDEVKNDKRKTKVKTAISKTGQVVKSTGSAVGGLFGKIGRGLKSDYAKYKEYNSPEKKIPRLQNQIKIAKLNRELSEQKRAASMSNQQAYGQFGWGGTKFSGQGQGRMPGNMLDDISGGIMQKPKQQVIVKKIYYGKQPKKPKVRIVKVNQPQQRYGNPAIDSWGKL